LPFAESPGNEIFLMLSQRSIRNVFLPVKPCRTFLKKNKEELLFLKRRHASTRTIFTILLALLQKNPEE